MFCNSDSCDSAICQTDRSSRPLVMQGFYFVYDPSPLFTRMRGREILRTSRFCALRPNGVLRSSRRRKNVPAPGHSRIAKEVRVLRGGLALDALYLLARDVDRVGELVGPEHPAVDHILDLPRSEVQILGRLPQGDFLASFVFHPTNLLARQRRVRAPTRIHRPGPSPCPYSPECVEG